MTQDEKAQPGEGLGRRVVLASAAVGAAGLALAACGGGDESTTTTPAADAPTEPAATDEPSGPATDGEVLVAAAEVPVAGGVIVESGQTSVVVTQPQPEEYVGLSAVCTHQGCLVNQVEAEEIICPCHGSRFSITDGAVLQGPATEPLAPVAVKVSGDNIVLG